MPIDVFGFSIPLPGDAGQPSAKDAQAQLDKAYDQARTDLANAQTDADKSNAQARLDQIQNTKNEVAARWAQVGVSQRNADTNATNAATNQQNANTKAQQASDTNSYHQRSLDLRQSADQALADYRNGVLSAKGDANKINMAKAVYQQQMAMINAQINQLKDEVTADTSLDTSADNQAVTQGDQRNKDALTMADAAAQRVSSPDMIKYGAFAGNPDGAAGAMSGLMQSGVKLSDQNGGAPVDVQNLALQHKMEIADLVMNKGVSFQDAAQIVAGTGRNGQMGDVPMNTGYTPGAGPGDNTLRPGTPGFVAPSVPPSQAATNIDGQQYPGPPAQ